MHHVLEALFPSKQDSDETQRRAPVATPIPNSDLPFIHLESESASSLPVSHALTMQHRRSSDSPVTSTQTRDADVLLRPIEAETLVRTPRSLTPISIPVRPSRFSSTTGGGQVSEEPILDVADESGYESSSTEVESSGRHGGSSADCSEVPHSVYRPKGSRKRRSRKSPQVPRPPDLAPGPPPAGKKRQLSRIQTRSATRTPPSSRTSRSASEGSRSRDESRKKKSAQPSPRSRSQQTLQVSESRSEDQTYHPMKDERRRKASGSGRWHGERT